MIITKYISLAATFNNFSIFQRTFNVIIQPIIKNHDLNGDGELDVDEFLHFWQAKTAMDVSTVNGKTTVIVEPSRGQRVGFRERRFSFGLQTTACGEHVGQLSRSRLISSSVENSRVV